MQELRFGSCYCLVLLLIFTELGTCSSVELQILQGDKVGSKHKYWTIWKFLHNHHKLKVSLGTLKTKLKIFGLARCNVMNPKHCTEIGRGCEKGAV